MSINAAQISSRAQIGSNVSIGAFTVVHDNVVIEDNVTIGSHCVLGEPSVTGALGPLVLRKNTLIRSHSIFYEGSEFGEELQTGHRVTAREGIVAGQNLRLGTLCDLQGYQQLGDYVRLHSNVHIGQKAAIQDYVWIFPYVVLTNDPHPPSDVCLGVTLESYSILATMACILPGVTVGSHSLVGASSLVKHDVPSGWVVAGQPAQKVVEASKVKLKDGSNQPAYPWTRHFHRGYPEHIIKQWVEAATSQQAQDQLNPMLPLFGESAHTKKIADRH